MQWTETDIASWQILVKYFVYFICFAFLGEKPPKPKIVHAIGADFQHKWGGLTSI